MHAKSCQRPLLSCVSTSNVPHEETYMSSRVTKSHHSTIPQTSTKYIHRQSSCHFMLQTHAHLVRGDPITSCRAALFIPLPLINSRTKHCSACICVFSLCSFMLSDKSLSQRGKSVKPVQTITGASHYPNKSLPKSLTYFMNLQS